MYVLNYRIAKVLKKMRNHARFNDFSIKIDDLLTAGEK